MIAFAAAITKEDVYERCALKGFKLVAEPDTADGGRAADDDGGHGAGVQERTESPAGDQEVRLALGLALGVEADADHGADVGGDDDEIHGVP